MQLQQLVLGPPRWSSQLYVETCPPGIWMGKTLLCKGRSITGQVTKSGAKSLYNYRYCQLSFENGCLRVSE